MPSFCVFFLKNIPRCQGTKKSPFWSPWLWFNNANNMRKCYTNVFFRKSIWQFFIVVSAWHCMDLQIEYTNIRSTWWIIWHISFKHATMVIFYKLRLPTTLYQNENPDCRGGGGIMAFCALVKTMNLISITSSQMVKKTRLSGGNQLPTLRDLWVPSVLGW